MEDQTKMKSRKLIHSRSNLMPPARSLVEYSNPSLKDRSSNWYEFADALDMGMLDLDALAIDTGYRGFKDMDKSINPARLHAKKGAKFMKSLKDNALAAASMSDSAIKGLLKKHSAL